MKTLRRDTNGIFGLVFRPASMTLAQNARAMHSSVHSVTDGFMDAYREHKAAMQIVAECAKIYIHKNYRKVDWSELEVVVEDNSGKPTKYYNYHPHEKRKSKSDVISRLMERIERDNKKRNNPVVSFHDVVLDPTDGDLSVTINGKDHLWLSDDTVIVIANYIEQQKKK